MTEPINDYVEEYGNAATKVLQEEYVNVIKKQSTNSLTHFLGVDFSPFPYEFDEGNLIQEIKEYIESTYSQHYAKGIQTTGYIMSHASTPDFLTGNCLKYVARYGKKNGYQRSDLMKAIHYLVLALYFHDKQELK